MALTQVPIELSSTPGIVDNSNATAITIDSSENVGIGTSSPGATYHLLSGSAAASIHATTNASTGYHEYRYNTTTIAGYIGNGSGLLSGAADSDFILRSEGALVFNTNGNNRRVTIDSSGDVGIGTASPAEKLDINGGGLIVRGALTNGVGSGNGLRFEHTSDIGQIYSLEPNVAWRELRLNASQQTFYIAGGEAMRITSSGSILAGNTSAIGGRIESANLNFSNSGNDNWKKGAFVGTGDFGGALSLINSGGASDGFSFYLTGSPSVLNIQHGSNGGTMANGVQLSSTATAFAAFSDSRLKTVTSEISDAVASVNTLRAVKYTLNSDDANTPRVGLIAQEVQAVLPEAVDTINDEGHLALRYTEVIPLLVAAIKEQQATIESQATAITDLTTRLTTLENN